MLLLGLVTSPPPGNRPDPPAFDSDDAPRGAGGLGMALFLVALSVLFAASLILYFATRARFETWPPPGSPPLPGGLWLSTLLILASSYTVHRAVRAVRRDAQPALRNWIAATGALGAAFLVAQTWNWLSFVQAPAPPGTPATFAGLFYFLTGVHAAHVIGGLVAVIIVARRAFRGAYNAARHAGVRHCAAYWHFLDIVWLTMLVPIIFF
jgi:cytochrome c oxidase subunit 3